MIDIQEYGKTQFFQVIDDNKPVGFCWFEDGVWLATGYLVWSAHGVQAGYMIGPFSSREDAAEYQVKVNREQDKIPVKGRG